MNNKPSTDLRVEALKAAVKGLPENASSRVTLNRAEYFAEWLSTGEIPGT